MCRLPADCLSAAVKTIEPVNIALAQMQADAVLPADIYPAVDFPEHNASETNRTETVLITGATGFLGRYVVKALLQQTPLRLICLLRADNEEEAWQRLWSALCLTNIDPGLTEVSVRQRFSVVCGNLEQDDLGLAPSVYRQLAQETQRIFHCAALVNWARSYRRLRSVNVLGTLRMIRFACHSRPKPLLFVSSLAVCFATDREQPVDEQTDMWPHILQMPLGYARSKCVAERLLRQAAQRGLPVTILRPALISGDTTSGLGNTEDFVAALLEGSTRLGMAMDTDWLLDFVPVDFVADVAAGLVAQTTGEAPDTRQTESMAGVTTVVGIGRFTVLHLAAEQVRYWRELILWLNLYGYPIKLVSVATWLSGAFVNRQQVGRRLYAYRRFFQGVSAGSTEDKKPFECYLQPHQQLIDSTYSRQWLQQTGLQVTGLNAALLQRYLLYFQHMGLLPALPDSVLGRRQERPDQDVLLQILRRSDGLTEGTADLQSLTIENDEGILHQLSAAYGGAAIGLQAYRLLTHNDLPDTDIMVKTKCNARLMKDSTVTMAGLCSPRLGELFLQFRDQLGLCYADKREAALYTLPRSTLRNYTPHCYGTAHDTDTGLTTIVLEKIPLTSGVGQGWTPANIGRVISGLAQIQSTALPVLEPLLQSGVLAQERSTQTMLQMKPLWHELAAFAAGQSKHAARLLPLQHQFIDNLEVWWPQLLTQPHGLIHNDFNPRNLALRDIPAGEPQLCVFDWELAAIGVPQRDLAEFLCFTLRCESVDAEVVYELVDQHRWHYSALTGQSIAADSWRRGFALALRQFVITRLPLYALMNRFRPQSFLPEVCVNAWWLSRLFCHTP